jgi:hypothetical protein
LKGGGRRVCRVKRCGREGKREFARDWEGIGKAVGESWRKPRVEGCCWFGDEILKWEERGSVVLADVYGEHAAGSQSRKHTEEERIVQTFSDRKSSRLRTFIPY